MNRVVGVVVAYKAGMLVVTGSEQGNYFIYVLLDFFFYLVSSFGVNFSVD